jgi:hypothetical protein
MSLAAIAAVAVLSAAHASAQTQNHLVGVEVAQARLHEAAHQRDVNLATLDAFVASREGSAAITLLGANADHVRSSLSSLSDRELHELAARAAALDSDPVAGALSRREKMYIGAGVVALILLIVLIS